MGNLFSLNGDISKAPIVRSVRCVGRISAEKCPSIWRTDAPCAYPDAIPTLRWTDETASIRATSGQSPHKDQSILPNDIQMLAPRHICIKLSCCFTVVAVFLAEMHPNSSVCLQFRCGEWGQSGQEPPGWGSVPLCRPGAPEPPSAQGEFPVQIGQRLRNVSQVNVQKLVYCQRKVSSSEKSFHFQILMNSVIKQ